MKFRLIECALHVTMGGCSIVVGDVRMSASCKSDETDSLQEQGLTVSVGSNFDIAQALSAWPYTGQGGVFLRVGPSIGLLAPLSTSDDQVRESIANTAVSARVLKDHGYVILDAARAGRPGFRVYPLNIVVTIGRKSVFVDGVEIAVNPEDLLDRRRCQISQFGIRFVVPSTPIIDEVYGVLSRVSEKGLVIQTSDGSIAGILPPGHDFDDYLNLVGRGLVMARIKPILPDAFVG